MTFSCRNGRADLRSGPDLRAQLRRLRGRQETPAEGPERDAEPRSADGGRRNLRSLDHGHHGTRGEDQMHFAGLYGDVNRVILRDNSKFIA